MTENGFSAKRVSKILLLLFASLVIPVLTGFWHEIRLGHLILWVFISLVFYLCFFVYMEHERVRGTMSMGMSNDYSLLAFIYLVCLLGASALSFLPDYWAPVLGISALCNGAFRTRMGLVLAVYFALLTALFSEGGAYVVISYVLISTVGVFFVELVLYEPLRMWTGILTMSISVVVPTCCNYLEYNYLNGYTMLASLTGSFVSILALMLVPRMRNRESVTETISLDTIMDESFHLRKEIERYSTVDYNHALKTSQIAERLAAALGADAKLARAGGFYYRVGKLEGEPFIENGVQLAQNNCFSERLVAILAEYNGENKRPSSTESAIVQIADMIVTKFDLFDKDTFSSGWNREIVIYQTMNEKSAQGLYDESGLSMNQFLTIRELLVKEEIL